MRSIRISETLEIRPMPQLEGRETGKLQRNQISYCEFPLASLMPLGLVILIVAIAILWIAIIAWLVR